MSCFKLYDQSTLFPSEKKREKRLTNEISLLSISFVGILSIKW